MFGSLALEVWNQPSACDSWAVRDVVAHLAWVAESYIERIHQISIPEPALSRCKPRKNPLPSAEYLGTGQRILQGRFSDGSRLC
jgi:hypothetical protein